MTNENAAEKLQNIFIHHFNIKPDKFNWDIPLEKLNEDFKILSYLVFLEQLIHKNFDNDIPIIENISTTFHSPKDVLNLIINKLDN